MVGLFPGALLILACKALKLPSGSAANTSSELGAARTSDSSGTDSSEGAAKTSLSSATASSDTIGASLTLSTSTVSISLDKSKISSLASLMSAAAIAWTEHNRILIININKILLFNLSIKFHHTFS